MPHPVIASVVALFVSATIWVSAQDNPSPSSSRLTYMRVCSDKTPPPCATQPRPINSPAPQYSKEARKAKIEGTAVLGLIVGVDGHPHDIHVVRYLGHGLDEEAIKALRQWTFEPGSSDGKAVPVLTYVKMDFRLH